MFLKVKLFLISLEVTAMHQTDSAISLQLASGIHTTSASSKLSRMRRRPYLLPFLFQTWEVVAIAIPHCGAGALDLGTHRSDEAPWESWDDVLGAR